MTAAADYGTNMFHAILAIAKEKMPSVILHLAGAGHLDTLESIYADKLFDPAHWRGEYFGQYAMGDSILPLLKAVAPHDEPRAQALVNRWRAAFDAEDVTMLRFRLRSMKDPALVRSVVRIGGRALDSDQSVSYFVKARLDEKVPIETAVAALESSCAIGNSRPLEFALDYLARTDGGTYKRSAAAAIQSLSVPAHMRANLGCTAVRSVLSNHKVFPSTDEAGVVAAWLTVLSVADVQAEQWKELGRAWIDTPAVPRVIAVNPDLAAAAIPALTAVFENGVAADDLLTNPRMKVSMPMLHCAVKNNNSSLVHFLLSCGADPDRVVGIREPKTAAELAQPGSETAQVIHAWRAQRAFAKVAARSLESRSRPA